MWDRRDHGAREKNPSTTPKADLHPKKVILGDMVEWEGSPI